jgi:hypothetical protein
MLQWLMEILESGEHALQVVGVGGSTQTVLAHSFIDALIAKMTEQEPAPARIETIAVEPEANPVPTPEQIAAYLAQQSASSESVRTSTVVDAATGAPQGTFQATA